MKKIYFTFAFSLLINCAVFGQKFQSGYLIFPNDSIIHVDIQLTSNNKPFVKYQENGKTLKAFKSKLKDYGTIFDGQQKSDYANSAFKEKMFDAYYVSKETGDTSQFYFLEHTYDKIRGYLPNREKLTLYPKDVTTVFIDDDETGTSYDGLDLKEYGSSKAEHTHKFMKRIIDGKIALYSTRIMKSNPKITYEKGSEYSYRYDVEEEDLDFHIYGTRVIVPKEFIGRELKLETNINYYDIYILRKGDQLFFSVYANTIVNGEEVLKSTIEDFPYLANKIGKPGYQFIDIPDILEEYNSYWAKRK